jgi:GAF domain-containing protein
VPHASSLDPERLTTAPAGPALTLGQGAIAGRVRDRVARGDSAHAVIDFMVGELKREFPTHSWSGVYLTEGESLVLGPFRGPDTPHKRIRIGEEGICGWVARHGRPQVIPDVNADARYLACSLTVKSELVVPVVRAGRVLGVIDVDSEIPAAFTRSDLGALTELAAILASILPVAAGGAEAG